MRILNTAIFVSCLSWLIAGAAFAQDEQSAANASEQRPNILFVYLDDFGWRDTGFMGSDFYETPHLDALAKRSLVFTDAYSCAANCAPARASLLSGQYTPRHRIFNVGTRARGNAKHRKLKHVRGTTTLRPDIVTWAEALQAAGYRTGMFGKWHLGTSPEEQGFDVAVEHRKLPGFKGHYGPEGAYLADVLTDKTIDFITSTKEKPWCAYLAHFAVHTPLHPKKDLLAKYEAKEPGKLHQHAIMATMIQAVDDGVGRIVQMLREKDLAKNTVILFYSDNGGYGPATDMDPLWGYKGNYYEGGIRVPFFVHWPGVAKPGKTVEPIIGVDLYPTLLSMAGANAPEQSLDGRDLVPLFRGEVETLGHRPLFWHFPAYLQSYAVIDEQRDPLFRTRPCSVVRLGQYKLHEYFEDGALELYDLKNDVREQNNLATTMPGKRDELHGLLATWREKIGAPIPGVNPGYDAAAEAKARVRRVERNKRRRARVSKPKRKKPVQVYILAGQSNMVGMGEIRGARCRYTGIYLSADPAAPREVRVGRALYKIAELGIHDATAPALGKARETLPKGSVRASIEVPESGTYVVHAGYGDSASNVTKLDGQEVYRKRGEGDVEHWTAKLEAGKRYPVVIEYEKGGSAAFWLSRVDLDGNGDLETVTTRDKKFPYLLDDDGKWVVRDDVWFQEARIKHVGGALTPGITGRTIGPELGFGHVLGDHHDGYVLVIKTAMGNRSLGWDFRPPSSGRTKPDDKWENLEYRLMVEGVRKTLANIPKLVPGYAGQGYEIAGFAWFQGHKDSPPAAAAEYEKHLVNLIGDVRAEFGVPKLPVVVATVGFGGYAMAEKYLRILRAQMAVGDAKKHPAFAGNVRSVDTRSFWREVDDSPTSQDYHYNRNAETYMLIGEAIGRAMVDLREGRAAPPVPDRVVKPVVVKRVSAQPADAGALQAALEPIALESMLPGFVSKNRAELQRIVDLEKPKRVTPFLRDASYGWTEFYRKAGIDTYDWHAFGPDLRNIEWHYFSFDPVEQSPKDRGKPRFRKVTYPDGMANWFAPDFDANELGWSRGLPPFGQYGGALVNPKPRNCRSVFCGCSRQPRSLWKNEVLLVRHTFECPPFRKGHRYRIVVGGSAHVNVGEGYAIYVNGERLVEVSSGVGRRQGGQPRGAFLGRDFVDRWKGGSMTIAATSFLKYYHPRRKQIPPEGHFAVWLEEMKLPPLGRR